MRPHPEWNYRPYRPLFFDSGEIPVFRIAPGPGSFTLECAEEDVPCELFLRLRGQERFSPCGSVRGPVHTVTGLRDHAEYEFFLARGAGRSRVRPVRTGEAVGTVVNYLHPEDEAYSFSGKYLCSPSMVRLPDGTLVASMDLFAGGYPQDLTLLFRSEDDGRTWRYLTDLFPCFWGRLFVHRGDLYMLADSTEYGDMLIGRSADGGRTWSAPSVLFRGGGGKNGEPGIHRNPENVITYAGRIWNTVEWGSWGRGYHAAMVVSAPEDADLLDPESWTFSEPVKYDPSWPGVPEGESTGTIEGTLVVFPDGKLYNVMRYDMRRMHPNYGKALVYRVDTEHPGAPLRFERTMDFPANHSKFEIAYDVMSGCWWSVATRIIDEAHSGARNLLSLMVSRDMVRWEVACDLYDRLEEDPAKVGFQYVDFFIEGEDLLFLCRTAMNGAHSFHDSNYSTFDRVRNFRRFMPKGEAE